MKRVLVTLILSILFVCSAIGGRKTDREEAGLIGLVKEVRTEKEGVKGRQLDKIQKYNTRGNLIEESWYHIPIFEEERFSLEKVDEAGSSLWKKFVYTYDAEGNRIEQTSVEADGSLSSKTVYTHDAKGNIIEANFNHYKADGSQYEIGSFYKKFVYTYDAEGNEIELAWYKADGSHRKTVFTYDAEGNRIEATSVEADGSLNGKTFWAYDAKGNRIEQARYKADGSLDGHKTFWAYDDKGNEIEEVTYEANGSPSSRYVSTYAYDTKGNWIKRTESKEVTKSGKSYLEPRRVVYRTITYFAEGPISQKEESGFSLILDEAKRYYAEGRYDDALLKILEAYQLLQGKATLAPKVSSEGKLEVTSWNWRPDLDFGTKGAIVVTGQVRNNSTQTKRYVQVIVTFYDKSGEVVNTNTAYTTPEDIPAGGTAAFKIYSDYLGTEKKAEIQVTSSSY